MKAIKSILSKKLLTACIVSVSTALFFIVLSGGSFVYAGKDDYIISMLLVAGDNKSIFLNYFLASIIVKFQQFVPTVNLFALWQQVSCFLSSVTIGYVFLKKFNIKLGLVFSVIANLLIFSTSIIIIQWTHTTTVMCCAGLMLLSFAFLYETVQKYKPIQIVFASFLILSGSMCRHTSFKVAFVIFFVFWVCIVITDIFSKQSVKLSFCKMALGPKKRNLKLIVAALLIFCIALGIDLVSKAILFSSPEMQDYREYNNGRAKVTDYAIADYEENKQFYNKIGITSIDDYNMITTTHIDRDYFSADMLNAIGDYSANTIFGSSKIIYGIKEAVAPYFKIILKIKNALSIPITNQAFVLLISIMGMICLASIFIYLLTLRKRDVKNFCKALRILLSFALSATWLLLAIYRINIASVLLLPILAFVIATSLISNEYQLVYNLLFSLTVIGLYLYQRVFRISFRVSHTFLVPGLLYLLFLFSDRNIKAEFKKQSSFTKKCYSCFSSIIMITALISAGITIWQKQYVPYSVTPGINLKTYIEANEDTTFVHHTAVYSLYDDAYYAANSSPIPPSNTLYYASWNIASTSYDNLLEEKGVGNLFAQMINNDNMRFILIESDSYDIVSMYENFYNNHYAHAEESISLVLDKKITCTNEHWDHSTTETTVGIYKVVSKINP